MSSIHEASINLRENIIWMEKKTQLTVQSGTTGLPKGCAFNIDRMYQVCIGVRELTELYPKPFIGTY